jgi:2,5-diketo-D-gluconate reductase A
MSILSTPSIMISEVIRMPQIGYGVFQIRDYDECRACVREAIACGYRLFDTAAAYFNEKAVGDAVADAIRDGLVKREDIFLTTKVWLQDYGEKETAAAVEASMRNLRTDYLDLVALRQMAGGVAGDGKAEGSRCCPRHRHIEFHPEKDAGAAFPCAG